MDHLLVGRASMDAPACNRDESSPAMVWHETNLETDEVLVEVKHSHFAIVQLEQGRKVSH